MHKFKPLHKTVIKKEDIPIHDLKKQNAFSNEIIAKEAMLQDLKN